MALIRRVSRLLQADLHAVLDQLEEPDILLRQAVREMEELLAGDRRRYQLLTHELDMLDAREKELARSLAIGESQLDLCFDNGREALARDLIRRRLESRSLLKFLAAKRGRLEKSRADLEQIIEQNVSRLESTRQKAELLSSEKNQESSRAHWPDEESRIRDQEVELELLQEKQKRGLS